VQRKLKDCMAVGLPISEQKAGCLGASHRAVNGRKAQVQGTGKFLKRQPRLEGEFQDYHEVLRVELHSVSIHSIFQNVEKTVRQRV
jgi:hypothetical protein